MKGLGFTPVLSSSALSKTDILGKVQDYYTLF